MLSQLPREVPFAITSNRGADFLTNQTSITLRGSAPIGVQHVTLTGSANPLPITWLNATNLQVTLPLLLGANLFTFAAMRRVEVAVAGQQIGAKVAIERWPFALGLPPRHSKRTGVSFA